MKKNLTEQNLSFLSEILQIEKKALNRIRAVIDTKKSIRLIIRLQYERAVEERKLTKKQIILWLMSEYGMSKSSVEKIIYSAVARKEKFCTRCASGMSKRKFAINKGVCDKCIVKGIKSNERK